MQQLDIGSVIGRAFKAMAVVFLPYVVLSTILLGPIVYWTVQWVQNLETMKEVERATIILTVVTVLVTFVLQGAVIHAIFRHLRGKPMGLGECIGGGFRALFMVLMVSIVAAFLTVLATFALVIPGLIVACVLYLVVPIAVIERAGVGASLSRSAELTRGYRWQIFLLVLFVAIVDFATDKLIEGLGTDGSMGIELIIAIPFGIAALFGLFTAACATVVYVDLRRIKENMDIEEIASLFE